MTATTRIQVEGVAKSLKILNNMDRDMAKTLRAELRQAVRPVVAAAKQNVPARPLSNWGAWTTPRGRDLSFDGAQVRRGIKYVQRQTPEKQRGRYKRDIALLQLRNQTVAGSVFELAGSGSTSTFNRNIEQRHGQPMRVLYKAWDARQDGVMRSVRRTIDDIEREVTRRLQK